MIADRDIGWLAGIIDGEGTVGIARTNDKRFAHAYYRPHVQIANTDMRILDRARALIEEITGRHPSVVIAVKGGNGWKRGYRLAVHSQREMLLLLPALIPHLIAKREQAEIVLEFSKRRLQRIAKRWHEFKDTDDAAYARCIALNRRGEPAIDPAPAPVLSLVRSA